MKRPPQDEPWCAKYPRNSKVRLIPSKNTTGIVDSVRRIGSVYLDKQGQKQKGYRYLYSIKVDNSTAVLTNILEADLAIK